MARHSITASKSDQRRKKGNIPSKENEKVKLHNWLMMWWTQSADSSYISQRPGITSPSASIQWTNQLFCVDQHKRRMNEANIFPLTIMTAYIFPLTVKSSMRPSRPSLNPDSVAALAAEAKCIMMVSTHSLADRIIPPYWIQLHPNIFDYCYYVNVIMKLKWEWPMANWLGPLQSHTHSHTRATGVMRSTRFITE